MTDKLKEGRSFFFCKRRMSDSYTQAPNSIALAVGSSPYHLEQIFPFFRKYNLTRFIQKQKKKKKTNKLLFFLKICCVNKIVIFIISIKLRSLNFFSLSLSY